MQGTVDDQLLTWPSSQTRNNPGVVVVVVLDRIDPSREDISSPSVDIGTATLLVSPWLLDGHHTSALLWQFHPRLEESFSIIQTYTARTNKFRDFCQQWYSSSIYINGSMDDIA